MSSDFEVVIHPTALVEKGAEIGVGCQIGPYSIVGPHVQVGDHVQIDSHAIIKGRTKIGAKSRIWPFASIGTEPQDLKYKGEDSELVCGERNMFREYVNISLGTEGGGGTTSIGNNNLLMVNAHVAHDCIIGNNCIFANGVSLAGHVIVGDGAVIGGHAAVHQFVKIGTLAMLAGGAILVQDALPFCTFHGNHASPVGINLLGLKRAGKSKDLIRNIKSMYKILFQGSLSLEEATRVINADIPDSSEKRQLLEFLLNGERGLCR